MPGITVEPITFALFGALGDLALRKLFPALYQLDRAGLLHAQTRVLALAREAGIGCCQWVVLGVGFFLPPFNTQPQQHIFAMGLPHR